MDTVGVVGLGTMGAGIAEVFAAGGVAVVGVEYGDDLLAAGRDRLERSTERAVRRGKRTAAERDSLLGRVSYSTGVDELSRCDLVVEAVSERLDLKREVFARLDAVVPDDGILATNTSSLSVTEIAASTRRPARVVGMHFFNPAPVQRLVEVVRTVATADEVVDAVACLAHRLGKEPVVVGDRAGFVANALLFGYLNRAVAMCEHGVAGREDVDAAIRVGRGYPMGPFELLDLIGLDTAAAILDAMHRETGDPLQVAAPLLRDLVAAGHLGRKTGRGFYPYGSSDPPEAEDGAHRVAERVGIVGEGRYADRVAELLARAGSEVCRDGLDRCDVVVAATDGAVTELAVASGHPDAVGAHVPVEGADLVEVVRTVNTAAEAVDLVRATFAAAGVRPVVCADRAGRIVDALVVPYLNDAVRMVECGYATPSDVDTAMKLGCALPRGPFELLADIGLPAALARQRAIHAESGQPGLAPARLLTQLVAAGRGFD